MAEMNLGKKRAGWKGSGKVRRKVERKRIRWEGKVRREGGKGGRKGGKGGKVGEEGGG